MTTHTFRTQTVRLWRRFFPVGNAVDHASRDLSDTTRSAPDELTFVTSIGKVIATRVAVANSFAERFAGLLKRNSLDTCEGLLLSPGGSIHTFGMRFTIDVLFLDRHMRVMKAVSALRPWRVALAPAGTEFTLELASGRIVAATIGTGMRLLWSETHVASNQ